MTQIITLHHLINKLYQGCHCQGKVRGKRKSFKVREKSGNFFKKKAGKIFDIVKVSEKSGNSVFWFIIHKFSSRLWHAFSFGKNETYAAKQAKRSIWHSTPDTCSSCGQWFSLIVNAFFHIPSSSFREKRKDVGNKEKNIDGLQKELKRM